MNSLKYALNTIAALSAGMILASIYITGDDCWKYYLPVCLIAIVLRQHGSK